MINPLMFREYDIRGIYGDDFTEEAVRLIGRAYADHLFAHLPPPDGPTPRPAVAVGRDGRHSSPALAAALAEGLVAGGIEVIDVGMMPSPGLYFAGIHFEADGAIQITGSHNPPDYNGMKMVRAGGSVYGDEIQALKQRILDDAFTDRPGGSVRREDINDVYVDGLVKEYRSGRPLKVVLDCGNGAAGPCVEAMMKRLPGIDYEILFVEVDGDFPNHHPDPTLPETLESLRAVMTKNGAELGLAFDGDGDRLGAVDEKGNVVWGDRLMILFGRQVLAEHPGATVIGDVKCSKLLFDAIGEAGGKPVMGKTGHSLMKVAIKETGALVAGEMSGHLFFNDRYHGFDDALYAAVRLMELVASEATPLSARLAGLPTVYATPELRLDCADDRKFGVVERIVAGEREKGSDLTDIDGARVTYPDGWWLIRVSNTQPILVARIEAESRERLHEIAAEVKEILAEEGVDFPEVTEV